MRVVLASTSPRRRVLLADAGVAHEAVSPGVDDSELAYAGVVRPGVWVAALAYMKARAGAERAGGDAVVIGADTVVVKGGSVIGQPVDAADAEAIVRGLIGGEHAVLTGVAVIRGGGEGSERVVFVDRSVVRVGWIDDALVSAYVESGEWRGKAGGYNLADRVGAGWPIEVEGDPDSVMGLPVGRVVDVLAGFGVDVGGCVEGGGVVGCG